MAPSEDDKYEQLRRRISRLEVFSALAFLGLDRDSESYSEQLYLLERFLPDFEQIDEPIFRKGSRPDDLRYLLDRLSRIRTPRVERVEKDFSNFVGQQGQTNERNEQGLSELRRKVGEISQAIDTLGDQNVALSAGTHEWLAIQSLGLDASEVKLARFLPLRVYLSDTPEGTIGSVSKALSALLDAFKFEFSDEFPAVNGSWFKKWFTKTTEAVTQPEVLDRLKKIERAIELKGLGEPQAEIDKKQSEAISTLISSLEKIPNAAVQAGSLLLVKLTSQDGPVIQVRTLAQSELIQLENNQRLLSSPSDLFEKLSTLCQSAERLKNNQPKNKLALRSKPEKKSVNNQPVSDLADHERASPPKAIGDWLSGASKNSNVDSKELRIVDQSNKNVLNESEEDQ